MFFSFSYFLLFLFLFHFLFFSDYLLFPCLFFFFPYIPLFFLYSFFLYFFYPLPLFYFLSYIPSLLFSYLFYLFLVSYLLSPILPSIPFFILTLFSFLRVFTCFDIHFVSHISIEATYVIRVRSENAPSYYLVGKREQRSFAIAITQLEYGIQIPWSGTRSADCRLPNSDCSHFLAATLQAWPIRQ